MRRRDRGEKENRKSKSLTIWDRVEPEKNFRERRSNSERTMGDIEYEAGSRPSTSKSTEWSSVFVPDTVEQTEAMKEMQKSIKLMSQTESPTRMTKGATANPNDNQEAVEVVDLTNDSAESSSDENKPKYPKSFPDILAHFDQTTEEVVPGMHTKDVTTLSDKEATRLQWKYNNNLKAEDSALDSINNPRIEISSLSSHATAARKLMTSLDYIDDGELKKLVRKASEVHSDIVNHLNQRKSQDGNIKMFFPEQTPNPTTPPRETRQRSRENPNRNVPRKKVTAKGNIKRVGLPPKMKGRVRRITVIQSTSSDENEIAMKPDVEERITNLNTDGTSSIQGETRPPNQDERKSAEDVSGDVLAIHSPNTENSF